MTLKIDGASKRHKSALSGQLAGKDTDNAAYAADVTEKPVSTDSLQTLRSLAAELVERASTVARLERDLVTAKDELADIQERRLPTMMEVAELPSFDFYDRTTGRTMTIEYKSGWRASMPPLKDKDGNPYPEAPEKRKRIFAWFREIGLGGLIKKQLAASLGVLPDDKVDVLINSIRKEHPELELGVSEEMHPSTLKAQVKRLKEAGKDVHEDIVVTAIRKAEVSVK